MGKIIIIDVKRGVCVWIPVQQGTRCHTRAVIRKAVARHGLYIMAPKHAVGSPRNPALAFILPTSSHTANIIYTAKMDFLFCCNAIPQLKEHLPLFHYCIAFCLFTHDFHRRRRLQHKPREGDHIPSSTMYSTYAIRIFYFNLY